MTGHIKHFFDSISDHTKHVIDWTSIGIALGSLIQVLPSIAAALSIIWSLIRIYETKTVQGWVKSWKKPNA
jgi:hypothetical protein